ncbi:TnsD family transposase [Leptolyngbya sp. AN02str]|uniref:TnsD family transposase n=1 Tax=Leptolyngbya sp. AN02str TaxID=3423363 RepID=UPI003D323B54
MTCAPRSPVSMLSFFPKPYPDELLYSVLARYHIRSGNISPKLTLQELFGSRTAIATADLPSNLEPLATNLSIISEVTVEDVIQRHTLFPFYRAFIPQERSQTIAEAMRSDHGSSIHSEIGIRASSVRVPQYFRFCPTCAQADQEKYGELYWHRVHQVPGVLVCPHHAEILQDSSVRLQGLNRHEYIAASPDNCRIHEAKAPSFSRKALDTLIGLAQDVYFLLEQEVPCKDLNWFRKQYMSLLIDRGLATATGRVHQKELIEQFLFAYEPGILQALDSSIHQQDEHNWLTSIVRKHRKAFHPIRHLLIIRFLGLSVDTFLGSDRGYKPFGAGPWLCLNPAAEHHLKPVVTRLEISLCCDTKKPVGTFSCHCGFIYCRTGPDRSKEDTYRIGKIKAVGSVWQQKLRQLVEIEQLGLRETARRLQVDPKTINRYVQNLGLAVRWRSPNEPQSPDSLETSSTESSVSNDIKTHHRNIWVALQTEHPQASKTALRQLAPATYTWLYRNDQEWLTQNSPATQTFDRFKNRVDWQVRDQQTLIQVEDVVQNLLAAEKPIRITVSKVAKAIGQLTLVEQHLDNLPLTRAYLESVIETIEDFQIRRVCWAAEQLNHRGETVEYWKVIRLAGLKPDYSEKVKRVLESEVCRRGAVNRL